MVLSQITIDGSRYCNVVDDTKQIILFCDTLPFRPVSRIRESDDDRDEGNENRLDVVFQGLKTEKKYIKSTIL